MVIHKENSLSKCLNNLGRLFFIPSHKKKRGKKMLKTAPKISVRIWQPIIELLSQKMDSACLRRDAYLQRVLEVELDFLDLEVAIPNSSASYDYVLKELDGFNRKLVSLALPAELTVRLNEICTRKRIVRDAFFNRLFLLLAAPPKYVDSLLFLGCESDWRTQVWSEWKHEGPFFQNGFYPLDPTIDPFWGVREGLALMTPDDFLEDFTEPSTKQTIKVMRNETGELMLPESVYTTLFHGKTKEGHNRLGLSCYLPDWLIPGHEAEKSNRAKSDELWAQLLGAL
jgi:hypothetical protein